MSFTHSQKDLTPSRLALEKLDPLTSHQQKRHYPERDQFINESDVYIH